MKSSPTMEFNWFCKKCHHSGVVRVEKNHDGVFVATNKIHEDHSASGCSSEPLIPLNSMLLRTMVEIAQESSNET